MGVQFSLEEDLEELLEYVEKAVNGGCDFYNLP